MRAYTREDMLALTPARYLADGYLDAAGQPRRELTSEYATAAATQLAAAALPAQELTFTFEALRAVLPMHQGGAADRARAAVAEALGLVTQMTRQTNNQGLSQWLGGCVAAIRGEPDIDALLHHIQAVLRLYTVIAGIPVPDGAAAASSSQASSLGPSSP